MKFNQLVDDAADNFEVAKAVYFAVLVRQAQLHDQFSELQNQCTNYFNQLFMNGKHFTLHLVYCRDLINRNYLKECLIGVMEVSLVRSKRYNHNLDKFNFLQEFFIGLFRSAFHAGNLKSILRPNALLAKIITSGFFVAFSKTIFIFTNRF